MFRVILVLFVLPLFIIPTAYVLIVRKVSTPGQEPESERRRAAQRPLGEQLP